MAGWEVTHSKRGGSYRRVGLTELYVRCDGEVWTWFLDGMVGGAEPDETNARWAAEAAIVSMRSTHTTSVATAAA